MSRAPTPDFASNVEGIRAEVLAAFVALKGEEQPRDYLGASSWGKACNSHGLVDASTLPFTFR